MNLHENGIISIMHKDDRIRYKKAFVENLNIRNEIFNEFKQTRKNKNKNKMTYDEKTFGTKAVELHFWDETISC